MMDYLTEDWGQVCVNGELIPAGDATVSPMDRGLLYGDGIFETIRVYAGKPFMLDAHLARMQEGCAAIVLEPPDMGKVKLWVEETLKANGLSDAYLRITITRGPTGGVWYDLERSCPTVVIMAKPYAQPDFGEGLSLTISSFRSDEQSPLTRIKHTGLLWKILARTEAKRAGVDDALLLNTSGRIAEATAANIFWVREGTLYTPSLDCGILAGVTRMVVIGIAKDQDIAVVEGEFPLDDLLRAEEAFLTSSTCEIAPIRSVADKTFTGTIPGQMTRRLMSLYKQSVERRLA